MEMHLPEGQRSTAWVKHLPEVVAALNNEETSLTGKKICRGYKRKIRFCQTVPSKPYRRPVEMFEKQLPSFVHVRYLYQPGELEGGTKRATDPVWSLKVFKIEKPVMKSGQPVMNYLQDGPKRSFVREELLDVPSNTEVPSENLS